MPRRMYKGLSSWLMILGLVFSMGMSQLNAILAAQQTAGHKEYVAIATTSLQQRAVETDNCLVDNPFPHGLDRRLVSPNLSESINHFPPSTVGPTSWVGRAWQQQHMVQSMHIRNMPLKAQGPHSR